VGHTQAGRQGDYRAAAATRLTAAGLRYEQVDLCPAAALGGDKDGVLEPVEPDAPRLTAGCLLPGRR
jgi:hypothetical protein